MCFWTRFGRVRWSNTWARLQIRLTNFYMIQFQLSHISRLHTNVNSLWINNIECSLTQAKWICWKIVLCAVPGTLSLGSFLLLENLHASKYHIGYTYSKKKKVFIYNSNCTGHHAYYLVIEALAIPQLGWAGQLRMVTLIVCGLGLAVCWALLPVWYFHLKGASPGFFPYRPWGYKRLRWQHVVHDLKSPVITSAIAYWSEKVTGQPDSEDGERDCTSW